MLQGSSHGYICKGLHALNNMTIKKSFYHNVLKNKVFQSIVSILSFLFLMVNESTANNNLAITIDVEGGYLDRNNSRVWMRDHPNAFEGYLYGIKNIFKLFKKEKIKATLFLSAQCYAAPKNIRLKIIKLIKEAFKEGHELGYHVHPKEDSILQQRLGINLPYTSSRFYSDKILKDIVSETKKIHENYLGKKIASQMKSIRWGNYSAHKGLFPIIQKHNILVDSSIAPNTYGHQNDDRYFDWRYIHTNTKFKIGKLLEVPITTFWFFGYRVVDPIYGSLLKQIIRRGNETVLLTHSCECTYKNGDPTYIVENLRKFIVFGKKSKTKFITISQLNKS